MVSRVTFIGTREQADDVIPMSQEDVTMYKYILDKHNKILILKKIIHITRLRWGTLCGRKVGCLI